MSSGVFVTYWKLSNLSDGPKYHHDQVAFKGGDINAFRKRFGNPRIVGYNEINDDGEISEACVMLNEPPPPLPGSIPVAQNASGGISAPLGTQQPTEATPQMSVAVSAPTPVPTSLPEPPKPKIVRNGNQYLKIEGDKISSLEWEQYDDSKAEFDDRIRATVKDDGQILIERTVWKELTVEE